MEHPGTDPRPFGLDADTIRACHERSANRPRGMSRFEAFAFQLESAVAKTRSSEPGLLPLARAYHRLRSHADSLADALAHGIGVIDRYTAVDTGSSRDVLMSYFAEMSDED